MGLGTRWCRVPRVYVILVTAQVLLALFWLVVTNSSTECGMETIRNPEKSLLKMESEGRMRIKKVPHSTEISIDLGDVLIPNQDLALAERDNRDRISRLDNLCKKYHMGRYSRPGRPNDLNRVEHSKPIYSWFFWNRARKLGYCPVYKAGYSSWRDNMIILAGFTETEIEVYKENKQVWATEVYGIGYPPHKSIVESSKKLLIVRHPFERLLSAYFSKLAPTPGRNPETDYYYNKYGSSIVTNFRQDASISQLEPTWEEFISYIITLNPNDFRAFDDHWLPIFLACDPCLVKWDFIGKTETYTRDQGYIIREMGLEHILKPKWANIAPEEESSNVEEDKVAKVGKYYAKLTKFQIKKLTNIYMVDFLLFGYDPDGYLQYGKEL